MQVVSGYQEVSFEEIDASSFDEKELYQNVINAYRKPFNLEDGPLMRVNVFNISLNNIVLLITTHHIVTDFISLMVLNAELWQLYLNETGNKPKYIMQTSTQYIDYVNWQKSIVESNESDWHWNYWKDQLGGELPVLSMPLDYPRPLIQTFAGASRSFSISSELTKAIKKCASGEGVTLFVFLLAVFQLFLHRYSGQDDIIVGTPTSGRDKPEFQSMIGYLVNMLSIRTSFKERQAFRELLQKVRNNVFKALEHQDYPFLLLVERLQPKRDPSYSPVFQATFELLSSYYRETTARNYEQYDMPQQEGQFDIMMTMKDVDDSLSGTISFNTDLFKTETIEKMTEHFQILMEGIANNMDSPVADLPLLSSRENKLMLIDYNQTKSSYPDMCVHQLFENQANQTPNSIAVSFDAIDVTYAELNKKANKLARLLQKNGVSADVSVGIMANRSIECIIGMIAVLKAGGAYLPIDPAYPDERIKFILEDSQTKIMLTQKSIKNIDSFTGLKIYLDNEESYLEDSSNVQCINRSTDLAYIIYTSGSTGMPKGAMIDHKGVVNYITWAIKQYGRKDKTGLCFPFFSSIAFDLTVTSIFVPLLSGNHIEVYGDDDTVLDRILREDKVDIVKLTPSHLKTLVYEDFYSKRLRSFIVGGEEFERSLAEEISNKFNHRVILYNEYGPTETVVGCMIHAYDRERDKGRTVPIGVPSDNVQLYVFDQNQRLVPDNVIGEMYIGGDGVCRGYLNRKELTMERFIENPYKKGDRIYRTGDLVRRKGKILEFIGRADQQVKIRGYRIECGEIEDRILEIEGIKETAVIIKEDTKKEKYLCCYYVSPAELTGERIQDMLVERIPHYMIPSKFVRLEKMPLNQNKKVDRRYLQKLETDLNKHISFATARNQTERDLSLIWTKVLKTDQIGIHDNFFNLGGNSLLAIQVTQQIRKIGMDCRTHTILRYPTIAELAEVLGKSNRENSIDKYESVSGKVELTPAQCWFFDKIKVPSRYNQYVSLNIKEEVNEENLEKALYMIIDHHDILRAHFKKGNSEYIQVIDGQNKSSILNIYNLIGLEKTEQKKVIQDVIAEKQDKFDISNAPILWAGCFKLDHNKIDLIVAIHYLVADYLSFKIIFEDLLNAYYQLQQKKQVHLPEKTTSFKSWADLLVDYGEKNSFSDELSYWDSGQMNITPLPTEGSASLSLHNELSQEYAMILNKDLSEKIISDITSKYPFKAHEIIITCVVEALTEYIGNNNVLIDFEGHGRHEFNYDIDLTRTVGRFTSIYPILFNLDVKCHNPVERIYSIQKQINRVPNNGFNYGILRYLKNHKFIQNASEPEIAINYLGRIDGDIPANAIYQFKYIDLSKTEKELPYLLQFDIFIADNQLNIVLKYRKTLFQKETIQRLADSIKGFIGEKIKFMLESGKNEIIICNKCVLPSVFPGTEIDEKGQCSYCRDGKYVDIVKENDFMDENHLKECLQKYIKSGARYHALVPLSGGVDSSSVLIDLVTKYKLKVLGFHNDHGYEDEIAKRNVTNLCKALDVDLIINQHDISFMKKLWRYTNASKVKGLSSCFVCGGVLYANAVDMADKFHIPLIINGYSKGQALMMANKDNAIDFWEEMIEEFQQDEVFFNEFMERQRPMSKQKVYLSREDLEAPVKPNVILVIPYYIFKFNKTDKEVLKNKCMEVFEWRQMNTSYPGRTTNCEMVWLNTYMDLKRMNYTMYHEEYASLVRKGELTRSQALADLQFNPPEGTVQRLAKEIELDIDVFK
ncbi:MAG: hypothetical protein JL50_11465 [Peptococcaceae bacterium BICA1-7]|nr:MAG: hypothetical protein JL50_11465 [Peptococcaceae bacterium BICA1-7]